MNELERYKLGSDAGAEEPSDATRIPLVLAGVVLLLIGLAGTAISHLLSIPLAALLYLGLLVLVLIFGRPHASPDPAHASSAPDARRQPSRHTARSSSWQRFGYQLLRYVLVGGTTTLLDFGILNVLLLLLPVTRPVELALYSGASYGITLLIAFLWHRRWTFRDAARKRAQAWRFVLLNGLTLSVNALVMLLLTSGLPLLLPLAPLLVANLSKGVATLTSGMLNFLGNRAWVFQATQPRRPLLPEREPICDALR